MPNIPLETLAIGGGILLVIVVAAIAVGLLQRTGSGARSGDAATSGGGATAGGRLPYRKKTYFFSKAERSFYEVLSSVTGVDALLFSKVRLSDLVSVESGTEDWRTHQNRIQQKHVDFLLCNRRDVSPFLVIELDDRSHDSEDRQGRDELVDNVLRSAGLPLLHVRARESYNTRELTEQIARATAGVAK